MIPHSNIQFIVFYAFLVLWIKNSGVQAEYSAYENEAGKTEDTHHANRRKHRNLTSPSSSPPSVAFEAPATASKIFWNYFPNLNASRRAFFDDFANFNYVKPSFPPTLSKILNFMSPFVSKDSNSKPTLPTFHNTMSQSYIREYPRTFFSSITERNFLPPPKPIRASIIKLETITTPPDRYIPSDYLITQRYPHSSKLMKYNTNSLHIDELGFHSDSIVNYKYEPTRTSDHKSSKINVNKAPDTNPTIYGPIRKEEDYIQASLPVHHTNISQTRVQNISLIESIRETNTENVKEITTTVWKENKKDNITFPIADSLSANTEANAILLNLDDNHTMLNVTEQKLYNDKRETSVLGNFKGHNENSIYHSKGPNNRTKGHDERTTSIERFGSFAKGNTIKIITDLTLEGVSNENMKMSNIPKYTKDLNISSLIDYELGKLRQEKLFTPRVDITENKKSDSSYFSSKGMLTFNAKSDDSFSLDLKILRDTNWDGFTTELPLKSAIRNTAIESMHTKLKEEQKNHNEMYLPTTDTHFQVQTSTSKPRNISLSHRLMINKHKYGKKTSTVETTVTKTVTKSRQSSRHATPKKFLDNETQESNDLSKVTPKTDQVLSKTIYDTRKTNRPEVADSAAEVPEQGNFKGLSNDDIPVTVINLTIEPSITEESSAVAMTRIGRTLEETENGDNFLTEKPTIKSNNNNGTIPQSRRKKYRQKVNASATSNVAKTIYTEMLADHSVQPQNEWAEKPELPDSNLRNGSDTLLIGSANPSQVYERGGSTNTKNNTENPDEMKKYLHGEKRRRNKSTSRRIQSKKRKRVFRPHSDYSCV